MLFVILSEEFYWLSLMMVRVGSTSFVRRFALRDGMWIQGETRRGNRGPQLTRLLKINEEEPTKYRDLPAFEELTTHPRAEALSRVLAVRSRSRRRRRLLRCRDRGAADYEHCRSKRRTNMGHGDPPPVMKRHGAIAPSNW